jgi:AcrR family transcriptional regulator
VTVDDESILDAWPGTREHREDIWEALVEPVVGAADPGLDALRRLRAELGGSMAALEQALAAPISGRHSAWAERVDVALGELSADLDEHVAVTEGSDGLHDAVLAATPRLSNSVRRLVSEHTVIRGLIGDLLARVRPPVAAGEVDTIRELGTTLLARLVRHRQHGADLIHQAYQVDLGGET